MKSASRTGELADKYVKSTYVKCSTGPIGAGHFLFLLRSENLVKRSACFWVPHICVSSDAEISECLEGQMVPLTEFVRFLPAIQHQLIPLAAVSNLFY